MSTRPYCKWYASDFIAGVVGILNAEQIGVYATLLNIMYARRKKIDASSAKDKQGLARACGCTTRRFNQIVDELIALPNKITRDASGRLSNPRFERYMAAEKAPEGTEQGHLSPFFEAENSRKNQDNVPDNVAPKSIPPEQKQTLNPEKPTPPRVRARARLPESRTKVSVTSTSQTHAAAVAAVHTDETFALWVKACARTIPRGWSKLAALKRWRKLPLSIPVEDLAAAWALYVADVFERRKQHAGGKFHPERVRYPESWLRDRVFESYLEQVAADREREAHTTAARTKRATERAQTIEQWNGKAQPVITKIGQHNFDKFFVGTTMTVHPDHTEIDFHKNDAARSDAEQFHGTNLTDLLGKVRCTSDRQRARAAQFKAKAQPP